ncbi:MAG: GvpL/GvpF family gas vesicle protein [Candidatus Aureabacteria bacterium]|nr:GvpL/GvpF family gas vesicle protein [Candidatus Auribacterota bacterium]
MKREGKYIYGIIESDKELYFEQPGIEGGEQVYTIPHMDIAAVVSNSELYDYNALIKDEVARRLIHHQQVLESVMRRFAVIPMRVGTYAESMSEAQDVLARGYELAREVFKKIADKVEIDVAVTWSDFNALLKETGGRKEVQDIKAKVLASSNGVTPQDQMTVGLIVKKALDEQRKACAAAIHHELTAVSCGFRDHELMDDTMVMNSAFLVSRENREIFDAKVDKLNARFEEKLNFRRIGPLPPYSFFTLEVKKLGSDEVNWARRIFSLGDTATRADIKKIRQKLAFSSHPDTNPDGTDMEKVFDDLTRAWKILEEYARASEQGGDSENLSFKASDIRRSAILVRLRE